MSNGRRHEFSYTHHLALSIALRNLNLKLLFDPSEDKLFDAALEHASKNGNGEIGKPDIMFRQGSVMVMIEVKHGTEKQVQWDWSMHPCSSSLSIKSDTAAVKSCAENGAMHYLKHALDHKELLAKNRVRTVLSIGASFDDWGSYTAVPFYGDVETGARIRSLPFHDADYFGPTAFKRNVKEARARLEGTDDLGEHYDSLKEVFYGHPDWLGPDASTYIMTLMWAMAMPKFKRQDLSWDHPFDDILDCCQDMCLNLKSGCYRDARALLRRFKSGGENGDLVPPLEYVEIARTLENAKIPCTEFLPVSVGLFGLAPELDRAKLMASCLADSKPERIVDNGSRLGLPGIVSAQRTGTESTFALVGKEPGGQLAMLAMLNLFGIREQNVYQDIGDVPSKPTKTVVADIARIDSGKQMAEARRMMRNVGQGRLGVFAVSRDAISSTAKEDVDARELLNSKYTLRKLIVCKEFAVMAVEKTENPNGTKMTKYICGRSQASTLVRNLGGSGLKFQSGKLNNGVWMR